MNPPHTLHTHPHPPHFPIKIKKLVPNQTDRFEPLSINQCLREVFQDLEKDQTPGYPTGIAGNRAQAIGAFSGAFKDMAKEFDIPFICLGSSRE